MKISQMTTEQAADILVRIAQPISNIMDDTEIETVIRELNDEKGKSPMRIAASVVPKIVPLAFKKHREDLFEIVGALGEMPVSKVKELPLIETIKIVRESVDKDLIDFLGFTANRETIEEAE